MDNGIIKEEEIIFLIESTLKDYLKYLPSLIVPGIISIIVIPIYTRLLSPGSYGDYELSFALFSILTIITSVWLRSSVVKFYPQYANTPEQRLSFYTTTLISSLIFSILGIILGFLLIQSLANLYTVKFVEISKIFLIAIIPFGLSVVIQEFFRAKREPTIFSVLSSLRAVVVFVTGLIFVYILGLDAIGLAYGMLFGYFIVPMVMGLAKFKYIRKIKIKNFLISHVVPMILFGLPLILTNLMANILGYLDRYLIGNLIGNEEVGIYSASYNLTNMVLGLVIITFNTTTAPIMFWVWNKKGEFFSIILIRRFFTFLVLLMVPSVVLFSAFGYYIIQIIVGPEFRGGFIIIPFIAISLGIHSYSLIMQTDLLMRGKSIQIIGPFMLGGVVNFVLNLLLLPRYGFFAAAWITLISYFFTWIFMILLTHSDFRFFQQNRLRKYFFGLIFGILSFIFVWLVMPDINLVSKSSSVLVGIYVFVSFLQAKDIRNEIRLIMLLTKKLFHQIRVYMPIKIN